MIESRASAVKASTSVLPFMKVTLTRSSSTPKNPSLLSLVGFTVVCSYRISLGNMKDEGLKELWCDLSLKKANFLNQ